MKRPGKAVIGAAIGVIAAVAAWGLSHNRIVERLELLTFDLRAQLFARPADDSQVKIRLILIDGESLRWAVEEQDQPLPWPWPRDVYTYILDYCQQAGAKAFVFDAMFFHSSVGMIVDLDEALGESIAKQSLFATAVQPVREAGNARQWPDAFAPSPFVVEGLDAWLADPSTNAQAIRFPQANLPIEQVVKPPTVMGSVQGTEDIDGKVRRVSLLSVFDGQVLPALPLSVYASTPTGAGQPPRITPMRVEPGALHVGSRTVPIDNAGRAMLRFRRLDAEGQPYRAYSAKAILQSALGMADGRPPLVPPEELKDAVIFFGASAPALYDLKPNPMNSRGPGVVIHATAYDNFVTGDFLTPAPRWLVGALALLTAVAIAALASVSRSLLEVTLAAIVLVPVPVGVSLVAYVLADWWPMAVPLIVAALAWTGGLALNYATEGRHRRFLRRAFSQYVSPAIVDRITREPGQLRLGGELRTLTMFFSDVEGFSTLSHDLGPQQITTLLNTYLSDMVSIIFDEQGTLDKYEGDAIIAFWNAPLDQPDHALRACRAAVRCQQRLIERASFYAELSGGQPLRMRIGLHSGDVVVGNMGSVERFDYTMLGDAANLASRLEGANRHVGTHLLISEVTHGLLGGEVPTRDLGRITVVGRPTPLRVYELLTEPRDLTAWNAAMDDATHGRIDAALARLDALADDPAAVALARHLRSTGGTWDGIRRLTEK